MAWATRTSHEQNNPQGIADPPTADMLLTPAAVSSTSNGQGMTAPSNPNVPSVGVPSTSVPESSDSPMSATDQLFANFTLVLNEMKNGNQPALSSVAALWQSIDALALQRLDALLSMEAGAMGVTKDTLMRDFLFANSSSSSGA
jgi:hypothetical protein